MKVKLKSISKKEITLRQIDSGDDSERSALIFLENDKFVKCDFNLSNNVHYDVDDWKFLRIIGDYIAGISGVSNA